MSSTTTKEGRLALFFEPDTTFQTTKSSLHSQVQQIIAQRGAFRNILEEDLRKEISQPATLAIKDGDDDAMQSGEEEESDEETVQARQQRLWKSREEMLQKLSYAQNEVLSALDFVSLLLSNHSKAAQSSMSPALTAVVQPGTLDAKVGESKQMSVKTKARLNKVSEGWKSESFGLAADKLGKAAGRLTSEMEGQGKYWEQIAHLKTRGWAISRLPADSRAIGVHFGFPESASQFRARGFALLQQDGNGNLEFDSRLPPKQVGPIRFIIRRNGVETGCFSAPTVADSDGFDMNAQLVRARDSLFEEELFYEINREARSIANQNVQTQARAVEAFISQEYSIRILQPGSRHHHSTGGSDDELAQFVALSSRFLLTAEHARLLARRSQAPAPMSLVSSGTPEYAILRPIITHLRHQDCMAKLFELYQSLSSPFKKAGIILSLSIEQNFVDIPKSAISQVSVLRGPARSSITLRLMSERSLIISLETFLGPPVYGTIYRTSDTKYPYGHVQTAEMHNLDEVRGHLEHVLGLELVNIIESMGKEGSISGLDWSLARPYSGDFLIKRNNKKVAKAVAVVEAGRLTIDTVRIGKASSGGTGKFVWTEKGCWSSTAGKHDLLNEKTLTDVIDEINKALQS